MSRAAQVTSLGELLESFFVKRLVQQQNVSRNTIDSYRTTWTLLLRFIVETHGCSVSNLTAEMIVADTILDFLDHLQTVRNCSIRTRNQRRAAIRAFAQHAIIAEPRLMEQFQRVLAIPSKITDRKVLGFLTKAEMNAILSSFDRSTPAGRRVYALLLFMYNTGARVSEVTAVRCQDIRQSQILIHGKGSKERVIPLWPNTVKVLLNLADEEQLPVSSPEHLFRNARGQPITRSGVAYILDEAVKKAAPGCESLAGRNISPHIIRHTTAMHLLQSGVDLNLIRIWLGHVNLDTTHGYVEADTEMKRRALEKGGITPGSSDYTWKASDDVKAFLDTLGIK